MKNKCCKIRNVEIYLLISITLFFVVLFESVCVEARVFNLNDQKVATYFKGATGSSQVLQTPFNESIDSGASVTETFSSNLAGEIGVVFTAPQIGFSLGVEMIHPKALAAVKGSDASAQELYALDADVSALIPKFGFDIVLSKSVLWRFYLNLSGGSGTLSYTNHYLMTATGQSTFSGLTEFSEEATASSSMMSGSFVFESFLSDATTFGLELGYRQLKFSQITFKKDVTNISGTHLKGDPVLNIDGTAKEIDFGGLFYGLILRFYL